MNARKLRERGESLDTLTVRDAVAADIPALAALHVPTPTLGFFDRMGGERLLDERGQFGGAFGWRDVRTLLT